MLEGIQSLVSRHDLDSQFARELLRESETAENKRMQLSDVLARNEATDKALSQEGSTLITLVSRGIETVGDALLAVIENRISFSNEGAKKYWARILAEAANEEEDLKALLATLRLPELSSAHSAVRKAIRRIDFLSYGATTRQNN